METGITTTVEREDADDIRLIRPPRSSAAWRVLAGTVLILAALGLFVIGGCFLIGIMELVRTHFNDPGTPAPAAAANLLTTLYVLAFTSIGIALVLLVGGIWGLFKVLLEKSTKP